MAYFQMRAVSFREGIHIYIYYRDIHLEPKWRPLFLLEFGQPDQVGCTLVGLSWKRGRAGQGMYGTETVVLLGLLTRLTEMTL